MRYVLALLVSIGLSACVSTYKQELVALPSAKLERSKALLVAVPKNGVYERREYRTSGQQTAIAVRSAFAKFSDRVVVSARCQDLPCLQSESGNNYAYLVVPEIVRWEDRNTEWSGKPDQIEVNLAIFDARSGKQIVSAVLSGKSKWLTFGGDHPEDLLPEPIQQYVQSLY